jgi:hypothetical protein
VKKNPVLTTALGGFALAGVDEGHDTFQLRLGPGFAGFLRTVLSGWLTQLGFIVLFVFILAPYGATWLRLQRRREVRENMRRIFGEREQEHFDR